MLVPLSPGVVLSAAGAIGAANVDAASAVSRARKDVVFIVVFKAGSEYILNSRIAEGVEKVEHREFGSEHQVHIQIHVSISR